MLGGGVNDLVEELYDEISEYKAKYQAVCAELEDAQKEIESLKKTLWHYRYSTSIGQGANHTQAVFFADKLEKGE